MLQQLMLLLLLLLRALPQHEEVVVHRKPSARVVGGAELFELWELVIYACLVGRKQLSHGIQTGGEKRRKNN